jgi:hypothetical protein
MSALLDRQTLDQIRRNLYGRNVEAVFYGVSPEEGEYEIGRVTSGFNFVRERANEDGNGKVKLWLSEGLIDRELLHIGGAMALIIDGISTRYAIDELLPQQQIGSGYVLRLTPTTGATG